MDWPTQRRFPQNWSRSLPRPLVIPSIMKLATLGDVRALIEKHLPANYRAKPTWRYVAAQLVEVARGSDTADVAVPLRMVLSFEGVECRPEYATRPGGSRPMSPSCPNSWAGRRPKHERRRKFSIPQI